MLFVFSVLIRNSFLNYLLIMRTFVFMTLSLHSQMMISMLSEHGTVLQVVYLYIEGQMYKLDS
jgi:hypothetical protein